MASFCTMYHAFPEDVSCMVDEATSMMQDVFRRSQVMLVYLVIPSKQVECVYLTVHITKLQLQTRFPKALYVPHCEVLFGGIYFHCFNLKFIFL